MSLDTIICLELVSPSGTKLQSSLFLWVVASTLPAPRNLISALLGLLNPLSCVQWGHGTGSFISTGIFPKPQSLLISPFHALFLHSTFPSILAKSTPLTSFATVVLYVFPISFPQKCQCIVWLYYFADTWFSHICLKFHKQHFSRSKMLKYR